MVLLVARRQLQLRELHVFLAQRRRRLVARLQSLRVCRGGGGGAWGGSNSSAAERSPCVMRIKGPKIKMMNGKEVLVFVVCGLGKFEDRRVERNVGA